MPGEKRSLRSNKSESSSANGEKARSNSQSSTSNKDKPVPTRSTSAKSKSLPAKKESANSVAKDSSNDKPHTNGTEPIENGVTRTDDLEMGDDHTNSVDKSKVAKDKDGDEEMTVVVPPPKGSKLTGEAGKGGEIDHAMDDVVKTDAEISDADLDPGAKAVSGVL